jgi:hypothetical protein
MCHKKFSYLLKICFPVFMHGTKFHKLGKIWDFSFLLHCHPLLSSFFYRNIPRKILVFNCLCSNLNLLLSFFGSSQNTCPLSKSESSRFFNFIYVIQEFYKLEISLCYTRRKDISRYFSLCINNMLELFCLQCLLTCMHVPMWSCGLCGLICFRHVVVICYMSIF